jgi:hypothetical protein
MTRLGIRSLWAVLLVATCGLLLPASAWAEPPANDKFEDRQVLGPGFPGGTPIEVIGSNVEATHEEGENLGPFAAGHSIWYEWEATGTGWTTIGVCEAGFPTIIGIFTGSKVDELTPVISGNLNASEGPDCVGGQRQFTFKAQAGTKYEIAVDGNGFYVEPPPPITEGEFTLRIEETPPPPNDDFAHADLFEGKITEEPDGSRFYFAHAGGYNWGATTEPNEPLDGPSDGATVWFTWTAPATATYLFGGPCCGSGLNWDLYTGNSLEELNENLAATGSAEVSVSAGTVFHIAVYGTPQSEGAEPAMASFQFNISANLPPLPKPPSGGTTVAPPDTTPPQTTIAKTKLLSAIGVAKFWLSSSEAGGSFLCRLDKGAFKPCSSPKTYRHLKPGRHTFRAEAVDAAGNVDQSPAIAQIKIPHKPRHGR